MLLATSCTTGLNLKFSCSVHLKFLDTKWEFLEKVAEHYHIDMNEHELFLRSRGELRKIAEYELALRDLLMIEILPMKALNNDLSSLRSYFDNEKKEKVETHNIIAKLTDNNSLTGAERKDLIKWLKDSDDEASLSKRRKIDDVKTLKTLENRDVQVNISVLQTKDSYAQTDVVEIRDYTDKPTPVKINSAKKSAAQKLMQNSFVARRHFILLKRPSVQDVYNKYPKLFNFEETKNELDRIFYPGKCVSFIDNMVKYSEYILQACNPNDEMYRRAQKNIKSAPLESHKTYARVVGSIFVLVKLLGEDCHFIHLNNSAPSDKEDVYPHIDVPCSLKQIFIDDFTFSVIVENRKLCEAPNFLEAILCLMASFFIFHIDYPKNVRQTLTVIEKLFLKSYLCPEDTTDINEQTTQMIKMLQLKAK